MFHQLSDPDPPGVDSLGGKGHSLCLLRALANQSDCEYQVPDGFIVTARAFSAFVLPALGILGSGQQLSKSQDFESIRHSIEVVSLPNTFHHELEAHIDTLVSGCDDETLLAVRSSSTEEDGATHSYAGLHDTVLGVDASDTEGVAHAIRRVWASLYSERACSYRTQHGISLTATDSIAVVIQIMPQDIVSSGVVFTADPVTNRRCTVRIESVLGVGDTLVSGHTNPDLHLLDTRDIDRVADGVGGNPVSLDHSASYRVRTRMIRYNSSLPSLSTQEAKRIATVAADIAMRLGCPQDVEFCLCGVDSTLYILQSRPITSLVPMPRVNYCPCAADSLDIHQDVPLSPSESACRIPAQHILLHFGSRVTQNMTEPFTPLGGESLWSLIMPMEAGTGANKYSCYLQTPDFHLWSDLTAFLCSSFTLRHTLLWKMGFIGDPQIQNGIKAAMASPLWKKYRPRGKHMTQLSYTHYPEITHPLSRTWVYYKAYNGIMNNPAYFCDTLEGSLEACADLGSCMLPAALDGYCSSTCSDREEHRCWESVMMTAIARAKGVMTIMVEMDAGAFLAPMIIKGRLARLFRKYGEDPTVFERGVDNNPTTQMNRDIARLATKAVECHCPSADTITSGCADNLISLLLATPWLEPQVDGDGPTSIFLQSRRSSSFVAGLSTAYPMFHQALGEVLDKWSHRGPCEVDIGRPRLSQDPTSVLSTVVGILRGVEEYHTQHSETLLDWSNLTVEERGILNQADTEFTRMQTECLEAMQRVSGHLSGQKRRRYHRDCGVYRACAGLREYPKDMMLRQLEPLARVSVQIVEEAVVRGIYELDSEGETPHSIAAMMTWRELVFLSRVLDGKTDVDGCCPLSVLRLLRERLRRYTYSQSHPLPVHKVMSTLDGCIHDARTQSDQDLPEGTLVGIPVSAGRVTGPARVIRNIASAHTLREGDILVTQYADPGWSTVFTLVSGVVLEVGGYLTHGSVVARELGLPAVASVCGATAAIKDGDIITIDGTTGYVEIDASQ
ncbi:hypothetical protein KIPB_008223 [Kipferlia bialata]|uniref:Phosphoenolpyruvate synthase n=1 Tax=Kipferlia bialata TaxID=797122 RepID=A0A9K3D1C3_9EUKA|nr:hypothetical protein KIPB_008223 [Kipferlia bialata]|eukprot:g8223.t1